MTQTQLNRLADTLSMSEIARVVFHRRNAVCTGEAHAYQAGLRAARAQECCRRDVERDYEGLVWQNQDACRETMFAAYGAGVRDYTLARSSS